MHPPLGPISFIFSFRQNSRQIIGFCPKVKGCRRPYPVWEILDPPLINLRSSSKLYIVYSFPIDIFLLCISGYDENKAKKNRKEGKHVFDKSDEYVDNPR